MISVVNGYVCTSSCDATKAKQGKDPATPPGATADTQNTAKKSNDPAVILDGALKGVMTASASTSSSPQPLVNKLI